MFGIDTTTAVPVQPAQDAPGAEGWATKGTDDGLTPATVIGQDWFNNITAELRNLVIEGGLIPAKPTQTQVRDAIRSIIGSGDRSPVINGACLHGNLTGGRPNATLTTAYQYGGVDRFMVRASGGAVTAGTITHEATTLLGTSGYSCSILGVTLTGAGKLAWRYRIQSRDAQKYKNMASIMVDCQVEHDVGANVNYTVTVNKANAQDNFTAVTQIATSAVATAVVTGTDTRINLPLAPGDVTNGIEIIVECSPGAMGPKNFRLNQLQLRTGNYLKAFQQGRLAETIQECLFFYRVSGQGFTGMFVNGTGAAVVIGSFGGAMRTAPIGYFLVSSIAAKTPTNSTVTATVTAGAAIGGFSADANGCTIGAFGGFGSPAAGALAVITTGSAFGFDADFQ